MKKLLLIIAVVVLGTVVAYAIDPKDKGYSEFYTGFAAPQQYADLGFMGLGAELGVSYYNETFGRYKESDYSVLCAIFNLTEKFGFDASLGYRLYTGRTRIMIGSAI